MVKPDFLLFLERLFDYYGKDAPKDGTQTDLWFKVVRDIPVNALDGIFTIITDAMESPPRNIPKAIRTAYGHWQEDNPHGECECSRGKFEVAFWRPDLAEWAIFYVPCGCRTNAVAPRKRNELLSLRYYQREPDKYMAEPNEWALIYPDRAGIDKKVGEIRTYLAAKKSRDTGRASERFTG